MLSFERILKFDNELSCSILSFFAFIFSVALFLSSFTKSSSKSSIELNSSIEQYATSSIDENPSLARTSATSSSTLSSSMNVALKLWFSSIILLSESSLDITFKSHPVSSLANLTFCPPRPMA